MENIFPINLRKDHIESVVIGILTKGKIRIIHICCFENVKSSLVLLLSELWERMIFSLKLHVISFSINIVGENCMHWLSYYQ